MEGKTTYEKGQAIVLLAVAIVVLLGFTALAIDGGMVFTDRRRVQNAADAAALSGALQKANSRSDATAILAAQNSVISNGYATNQMSVAIDNNYEDFSGHYILVTVVMTTTTKTNFAQLITGSPLRNVVNATARARLSQPAMAGTAIVAMGNCISDGDHLISVVGGGHTGGVLTFDGGMFVNTPENSSNECAINPPNSAGTPGITAETGYPIYSVGSYDYSDAEHLSPIPVDTGINGGVPITDPWVSKPEPTCTTNGSKDPLTGHYKPGYYGGAGQPDLDGGVLDKGIYCITGDIGGNIDIDATAGVVLYFISGAPVFHGNGDFRLNAPDSSTCLGSDPDTSASCTYAGFALFMARSNTSIISLTGNGVYKIVGLVYAINGGIEAKGGGTTGCDDSPDSETCDWVVKGQVIAGSVAGDGNGSFSVTYNAGVLPKLPTQVSLQK
jgi:Flp pilus assembly protein TadG